MSGAVKINHGESDCVINWAGGLHHAKKGEVIHLLMVLFLGNQHINEVPRAVDHR